MFILTISVLLSSFPVSPLERDGARSRADERQTSETATSPSFRCTYLLEEGDWEELVGPEGAGHS